MDVAALKQKASVWWEWLIGAAKERPVTATALALLVGGSLSLKAYRYHRRRKMIIDGMTDQQKSELVVLITGASSGIGNALALKLHAMGLTVIATGRREMTDLSGLGERMLVYKLDITQNEECEALAQKLKADGITLWGIVNNAGMAQTAPFEAITREKERYEYDVLFHGQLDLTRALLPLMLGRQVCSENDKHETLEKRLQITSNSKTNGGRIVNVCSYAAEVPFPMLGRCCAAKAALQWWSHSLRNELSPRFGIWVAPLLPGNFLTPGYSAAATRMKGLIDDINDQRIDPSIAELYGMQKYPALLESLTKDFQRGANPDLSEVVNDLTHSLLAVNPFHLYKSGWRQIHVAAALPLGWQDWMFGFVFAKFP